MTFTDFIEQHKGVRRTVLAFCIAWTTAGIAAGIYVMLQRPMSGPEASFLLGIIGLPQIAVNWYFQTRGRDDGLVSELAERLGLEGDSRRSGGRGVPGDEAASRQDPAPT